MTDMATVDRVEKLEQIYDSKTFVGLVKSGYSLLQARRVKSPPDKPQAKKGIGESLNIVLFVALIIIPGFFLTHYQKFLQFFGGKRPGHPLGSWQWALNFSLREDLAHHTVETVGYHKYHDENATETDDLAAWIMTLIQFVWSYEDLMGVVWDEWTLIRLVTQASHEAGMQNDALFKRLQRQWEVERPYNAPLNGTYADVRRIKFEEFITPRLEALPEEQQGFIQRHLAWLREEEQPQYQKQMSVLSRIVPGSFRDHKEDIPLWDACIGLVIKGKYYLIRVAAHDENGFPLIFGPNNERWPLKIRNGKPYGPGGEELYIVDDQFYRVSDGLPVGYLDMAPFSAVKHQILDIFEMVEAQKYEEKKYEVDVLLAETPRRFQHHLRGLLPHDTQRELEQLSLAPIILNWDEHAREDNSLAELRRVKRGVGDHALTVIRTTESFLFDQHHIFFDGTWSLAMAEVLTNAAIAWCRRGLTITPGVSGECEPLHLEFNTDFLNRARPLQQLPEISAETVIHDITQIMNLRKMIQDQAQAGLTMNDLLVTTRVFHSVHYKPSQQAQDAINEFKEQAKSEGELKAIEAIEKSLVRGKITRPALSIPIDASPANPIDRLYLLTFRNLYDDVIWSWDNAWEAYQAYRRIEPPDTFEGRAAFAHFAEQRRILINSLKEFSYLFAVSKQVAIQGLSFSVSIFNLLANLPPSIQYFLRLIPEQFPALNEIIRGDEIYSNIGRVARDSTLSRFITAKDDGRAKVLAWGIMSDNDGKLVVTMRDFRPHVAPLVEVEREDLAKLLAQDYVEAYTNNLFGLVAYLMAMLMVKEPKPIDD